MSQTETLIDPIEIIKRRMFLLGYKADDLAKAWGNKGEVSKVLNYKKPLTLSMIRKFTILLDISADHLIKEYDLRS